MTRNSRLNSLSGTKNKRLLFQVVKTNWTHNNRPFLDTRSLSEENIAHLLNDKDSENTKKSTKQHRLSFESYLEGKNIRNPTTAVELDAVLRKFCAEARKKDGQVQNC